jgi:hypothetical protein
MFRGCQREWAGVLLRAHGTVITSAMIIDTVLGIVKADIGIEGEPVVGSRQRRGRTSECLARKRVICFWMGNASGGGDASSTYYPQDSLKPPSEGGRPRPAPPPACHLAHSGAGPRNLAQPWPLSYASSPGTAVYRHAQVGIGKAGNTDCIDWG